MNNKKKQKWNTATTTVCTENKRTHKESEEIESTIQSCDMIIFGLAWILCFNFFIFCFSNNFYEWNYHVRWHWFWKLLNSFFSFINLHLLPVICFGNRVQGVNKWTNRHFNLLLSLEKSEREIKCCALWRWSHSIFFSSSFLCSETCSFRSIDASTIIIIVAQVVIDVGVLSIYRATEKKKKKHFKKLLHTCNFLLSFDLRQLMQTRSISRPWILIFFFFSFAHPFRGNLKFYWN